MPPRSPAQKPPLGWRIDTTHPLTTNLSAAWLFNERAGGTAHDASINGQHGTLTAPAWGGDKYGNSTLSLAGSTWATIPNALASGLNGYAGCSGLAWVRRGATGAAHKIVTLSTSGTVAKLDVSFTSGGTVQVGARSRAADSFQAVATSATYTDTTQWLQVGWAVDIAGDAITVYVDGTAMPTTGTPAWTPTAFDASVGNACAIGASPAYASAFSGDIGFIYMWNRLLAAADFASLALAPYQMFRAPAGRFRPIQLLT